MGALDCRGRGLWALVLGQLSEDWAVYVQYNYGWLVPLLALYLAWRRWMDRPAAHPLNVKPGLRSVLGAALLLPWLPLWLVREANPDWRLVSWSVALLAVGTTGTTLAMAGGWHWVRTSPCRQH